MSSDITSSLAQWPRHRWISLFVILAGLVMALMAGLRLGGNLPELAQIRSVHSDKPISPFQDLLQRPDLSEIQTGPTMVDGQNPFYTDYFKPPPKPAPPPKPTMKKIEILYQGWFESSKGEVEAFVTVDGKKMKAAVNQKLGSHFQLIEIQSSFIRLKGDDDQEHKVPFSKSTPINVPIP